VELAALVVALDHTGGDGRDRAAVGGLGSGVRSGRGLDALVPGGSSVNTHGQVIVAVAGLELAGVVVGGHVPGAAHDIIDVLAVLSSVGTGARTEAELIGGHKVGPFVVLEVLAKGIAIHKATNRVTVAVSTVRVKLASLVILGDVDLGKVTDASNLDIVLGLDEMDALKGTLGHDTSTTARLGAPCDLLALSITNGTNARGSPEAKVINVVEPGSLAHRLGVRVGGGNALVRASLSIFGLVGRVAGQVANVPDLVGVPVGAGPDLRDVAVVHVAVGEIYALAMVGPGEMLVTGIVPVLVGVVVAASPDLELGAIDILAILDVEALVAVDLDVATGTTDKGPLLGSTTNAVGNNDGGTVLVVGLEALGGVVAWLDEERALVGRSLGSSEPSSEGNDDSDLRHSKDGG